jgi:mRNA deadenylase 3'-5' endonuclease subunit Ccr4
MPLTFLDLLENRTTASSRNRVHGNISLEDPLVPDFAPVDGIEGRTCSKASKNQVRIVSWNVLADRCLRFHPYISFGPDERNDLLRKTFEKLMAQKVDIICLQEVDTGFIEEQVLQGTYKVLATHWGLASCICFRVDTWRLVGTHEVVKLDDLAGYANTPFAHTFRRYNHGILARLERLCDGMQIVICNTHLYWDPDYEHVKLCQAHYLLLKAKNFIGEDATSNTAFMFCGDLNSLPGSLVHQYLSKGKVEPSLSIEELQLIHGLVETDSEEPVVGWLLSELVCPFRLQSSYADQRNHGVELYPFTNVTPDFQGFLDYVFYQPTRLRLNAILPLPESIESLSTLHGSDCLPSSSWPSDHLLVGAAFTFAGKRD